MPIERTEHHVWCNGSLGSPVKGCRWCDPDGDGKRGLWAKYPYDPNIFGSIAKLVKEHFPEATVRH